MEVEDMNSEPQKHYIEKNKIRKRKKFIADDVEAEQEERHLRGEPSKLRFSCQRVEENDEGSIYLKEGSPWRNLQLILSLQDKNINLLRKVGLAFDYAKTSSVGEMYDTSRCSQVMNTSRTLVYLNNWVHSVLIASEKKIRHEENKCKFNTSGSYLDFRCWKILHFCLEQSKDLHISLTCSKDFLRVVRCITMDASSYVNVSSCHAGTLSDEQLEFYDVVLGCMKFIFSFHGGVANENLDLWILVIDELLEVILKIIQGQLVGSKLGNFVLQLSYCLLEPFAKFLRVHPTRKNGFRDFIDKLFEPLLHLLHVLHCDPCGNNIEWKNNLSKLIKDVLAHGIFHSTHIDGFVSLQSIVRYINASDATPGEDILVNKSYHRHLFNKVETMVETNKSALIGLGQLLHLFVSCIAKHKGASFSVGVFRQSDVRSTGRVPSEISQSRIVITKENSECHVMNAELRNCVFNFFAQIMEYLLANVNTFLQSDVDEVSVLLNSSNTLRSISMLLDSVFTEKVYLRLEDTSDGASRKFLKVIYDVVMLLFAKITHPKLSCYGSDERSLRELLVSARKELIITTHHLLNIEYEVVGDDLEKLWTLVLTSMNCSYRSTDVFDQPVLSFEILTLGCRLIDLYSELRQVNSSIFALCKAVRRSMSILGDDESWTPLHHSSYSNAINMLLCSLEFRLSLSNAIKTIPEGQTAECIHQLSSDIMESVEWMKFEHQLAGADEISKPKLLCFNSEHFDLRAETLGKALSEVYVIILDSITINSGNSYLVGVSVKNLIEMISSSLSNVVPLQSYTIKNFSIVVDGRASHNSTECKNVSTCWILVFLCRLLLSCRSLFRQVISLIPPATSKKMSRLIGDSFTLHSARDWLELSGLADKGSFSLILQPSGSFLDVIRSFSSICIQNSAVLCPPLVYILNAMATMRLVDLNKLIASSEYVLHWNQTCNQPKLKDEAGLSSFPKRIRKWTRHVSEMKEEAADLTKFVMEFLSSVSKDLISTSSVDAGIDDKFIQCLSNNGLNFSVGFINEKSLPCALWWIICQNVDVWYSHATRKELKNFLSLLIKASISDVRNAVDLSRLHNIGKPGHMKKVSAHQIALEFLRNTITYEQRFVCRYMASRFCTILQKSALFLSVTPEVDLSESPDWDDVIYAFGNLSTEGIGYFPRTKSNTVPDESCSEHFNVNFSKCQSLLTLLMWMPEDYFRLRSSSLYITCILNLERLLVGSLLRWHGALNMQSTLEIFRLFVLCRRVLKNLTAASYKENINGQPELPSKLPEYSFPLSWLPKSLFVVIGFRCAFQEDTSFEMQFPSCSLMDHTSNALLIVSRDKFARAFNSYISSKKLHRKRKELKLNTKESDLSECTGVVNHHENLVAGKSVIHLAKILEEFLKNSLDNFVDTCVDKKLERLAGFQDLNKFSAIMACYQGLFWGLASALVDINAVNCDLRIKLSRLNADLMTKIDSWVHTCVNFIIFCLKAVLLEEDTVLNMPICDNNVLGTRESSTGGYDCSTDASGEGVMHPNEKMISSDIKGDIVECNLKRAPHPAITKLEALLTEVQLEKNCVKKNLLLELLRGENADVGFFLQQLFIACSAVLRLNLQINLNSISWGWFPIVVNISQHVLLEFSSNYEMTNQFAFVWLLGVVKFLEELGSYFSQFDPSSSRGLYVKLVGLHIMAIGKCISLQGKEATLTSQERGLHVKMLASTVESYLYQETSKLIELKGRLRISFTSYIRKSSELHLLSAIQAVERALVGVQEGLMTNYEIRCGSSDGGKISADLAAGVDCLYLILEFVTGHRRLSMIKRHIQSFVACLFNVILHLQAPSIFRGCVDSIKAYGGPDPGSVVLMCVEVLTKIYGKPSFFRVEAYHIAQSLRVPAPLFQYFLSLQISEAPVRTASGTKSNADQKFSTELYSACCRLLCTTLKHHKNETRQFISLLEDSVSVLLHSLEIVNTDPVVERASYAWEVSKAVECASSLRRVYEEVRQEKEVFGLHAFKFLSRYIWVYCGYGPAKRGIRREVDEALKPGIYALVDSCSVEDLQLLHTNFEEGPCRSTLAALQHDYKLNFQFQGKV
ncbi:uncharacterized protein LOC142528020 isoform X1 [Primulina tabacum]|uniref:uncharacterized protein LOC142528020 isoform X1 n=2 Tax=Primulina tabacum TaxID=48773 RepID=UPI003F5A4AC6